MKDWLQEVITALDLDEVAPHVSDADLAAILDGARHAAHEVERPAAPVTTYLMGMAVARGGNIQEISTTIEDLAKSWAEKNN
ncbi:MAG: hypothetical protein K0U30_08090 [Actinomycetia bacterium]|jgi:hypothetical protein|nr:hypothetical protein [Actinomycetes bacterium]MCH9841248.1 hypothetical protein [Actinomycetes bacterium]